MLLQQDIEQRGYAELEHGIPNDWIDALIERYADFTLQHPDPSFETMSAMLPAGTTADAVKKELDNLDYSKDTQKEWHKYRTNVTGVGKPDGYTNRSLQVSALRAVRGIVLPEEDPKEFYHHTPRHFGAVARQHKALGWGAIPPEVSALDTAFGRIHHKATELITKICAQIEETHSGLSSVITPEALLGSPLRLLFYHPSSEQQLAAGHYDKSVMTVQIGESHQGLRVATQQGQELTPVVRDASAGVLFMSHTLSATPSTKDPRGGHYPDSTLRPAWHDVIADNRPNTGRYVPVRAAEVCARWALIFFVNENNYVDPGKNAMHSRG
jgi:hypothetical protein